MKTKNMPYKKYLRRLGAQERLNRSRAYRQTYPDSYMGKHEAKVLDERIKDYASRGKRPSRGLP